MALRDVDMTAPGKLALLGFVIVGCFCIIGIALTTGDSDSDIVVAVVGIAGSLLSLVVGYLIGNGAGARSGITTVAPFSPKVDG